MTHKVKRGLISIVMAVALVISVLAGVLPLQSIKVGAETEPDYLTFTAEEDNSSVTVNIKDGTLEYSVNNGEWAAYTSNSSIALNNGYTVRFRGDSNSGKQLFGYDNRVTINGKVACSGNIMTLLNYNDPKNATMSDYCFSCMFYECAGLTSAPELPATTLTDGCYESMFVSCTRLTSAPELPATTLAFSCYNGMFHDCTGLTSAPALPATTLTANCYCNMFSFCTSLTEPPALPATELAEMCYDSMFMECTSLTSAPALPATSLANSCYSNMFYGCTSIKLSETQTAYYNAEYRIPSSDTGTDASYALNNMFASTGGAFTGTPDINKTYYIHKDVVYSYVEPKAATYEADGNSDYYTGSDGKFYKSEDDGATFTEIEENSWIIPRLTAYMQVDTDSSNGVDVNICAPLPEGEDINEYSIQLGDTVQSFSKCSTVVIDGTTYYLVKVTCPAKNMADKYAYAVQKNGTAKEGASGEVSVRDYADNVIGGNYTVPVKKVCRAMLAYGTAAQTYFDYKTTDPANKNNSTGDGADYSTVKILESVFDKTGLNEALEAAGARVEYVGMSLTLKHDTYISLAFKVTSGTQEDVMTYVNQNFTLGGNPVSAEKNGTSFVVIRA
ncbi:MAG: hypothetical protein J6M07_10225, partial [Ruminococcus sp.]|nr:hypothetical protein [Ruminococcus sp.]